MEIYRISCVVLFIMMLISFILLALFPFARHKENFYMQMLNNLNVGFFSGLMVSFSMAYLSYFYAKEAFFNTLLRQSMYIYSNLETMSHNIKNTGYTQPGEKFFRQLPVILSHLETYTNVVEEDAKKVNFLSYSPFVKSNDSYRQIESLQNLFFEFKKYPDFFIRMRFLENERNLAITDYDTNALNIVNQEIVRFMQDLDDSVNGDIKVLDGFISRLKNEYTSDFSWESFKKLAITPHSPPDSKNEDEKTSDKEIKKD